MALFLATKEFWLTLIATFGGLILLWKGLKIVVRTLRTGVREVQRLIAMVTYTQNCLEQYGPTLLEIAKAFHGDTGKSLIAGVSRIELLSQSIERITKSTQKASDRSIDVLQSGVVQMQADMRELVKAVSRLQPPGPVT